MVIVMLQPYEISNSPKITGLYTAYSKVFDADYRFHGETHDFWELVSVTDGHISVAADSRVFELKKGQAILHSPMQFHNITVMGNAPTTVTVFTFRGENIPEIQNNVCCIDDISGVKTLYESAVKHFTIRSGLIITGTKTEDGAHLEFVKRLELFLVSLAANLVKSRETVSQKAKNYSVIVNTMNGAIGERLSVNELAELCNMSEINLQKTFSYYAGVGVMEYFNRIKMRRAKELLEQGLSVREAALQVGFTDQNYFSTVFKRITGHTPSESKL